MIQLEASCNVSSYNTTQSELAEVVTRINETLRNNGLRGVPIIDGSVLIAGLKRCATAGMHLHVVHYRVCVCVFVCSCVCVCVCMCAFLYFMLVSVCQCMRTCIGVLAHIQWTLILTPLVTVGSSGNGIS